MFFPQFENNLIIITICKGWELRRRVDQCQSFQFYWNLNHPPPPSSCQEEVGFQKLQKPPKFLQKKRKIFSWPASWKNPNFINVPLPTDCYCHNPMIIRGEHICGGQIALAGFGCFSWCFSCRNALLPISLRQQLGWGGNFNYLLMDLVRGLGWRIILLHQPCF